MMQVVSITQQGQITIPKSIRDNLKIDLVSKALVSQKGDTIVVKPVLDFFSLEGSVKPKRKPEDFKSMRKAFISQLTAKTEKIHILSFDKDFDRLYPRIRSKAEGALVAPAFAASALYGGNKENSILKEIKSKKKKRKKF